jgi:amino acid adenylation domain-containing protein/thioester reductase-like protein
MRDFSALGDGQPRRLRGMKIGADGAGVTKFSAWNAGPAGLPDAESSRESTVPFRVGHVRYELRDPRLGSVGVASFASAVAVLMGRFVADGEVHLAVEHHDRPTTGRMFVPVHWELERHQTVAAFAVHLGEFLSRPVPVENPEPTPSSLIVLGGTRCPLLFHAAVLRGAPTEVFDQASWMLADGGRFSPDNVDCWFHLTGGGDGAVLHMLFDQERFADDRMRVILDCLAEIMRNISVDAASGSMGELRPSQVPCVPEELRTRLLGEFQGRFVERPDDTTIYDLIEEQAGRFPDKTALQFRDQWLTYAELLGKAGSLAHDLTARGIQKGDFVALTMGNSLELPVAMLAAMQLGVVFVPVDERWPPERIRNIMQVVRPCLSIGGRTSGSSVDGEWDVLHADCSTLGSMGAVRTSEPVGPGDLAYGFCTSGSSGEPKCALNLHRGLLNRFLYMTQRYESGPHDIVFQNSPPVFDSSLWQLLWPLTNGGSVVIPERLLHLNLQQAIDLIERHGVTMTDFVPTVFNALVSHLEQKPSDVRRLASLRHLLIGGEEISVEYCRRFTTMLPHVTLTNTYGPTEASIGMIFHRVSPEENVIPLGRPIDNTCGLVLDEHLALLPLGAVGQLYIGGTCLGPGYRGAPASAAQAWVTNPFAEIPGSMLYRTGDIVHQDARGQFYFLGRMDQQIKLGGVRIELGEIEQALLRHPLVAEARVAAEERASSGRKLVAYLVLRTPIDRSDLRTYLETLLPKYMVPSQIHFLDSMPLTHNGKIDRKRLAESQNKPSTSVVAVAEPIDADEKIIHTIWCDVLGLDGCRSEDSFFDCGGDSLLAVALVRDIERAFSIRLGAQEVYSHPTMGDLAQAVRTAASGTRTDGMRSDAGRRIEQDIRLIDGMVPVALGEPLRAESVLVTGASGFVGVHLLAELLARNAGNVTVLQRAGDAAAAEQRIVDILKYYRLWNDNFKDKLDVVPGDLERDDLGLEACDLRRLTESIDTVVHAGAVVHFLHDYSRHRGANVRGTARLLQFAAEGRPKVVHYLSSLSIFSDQSSIQPRGLLSENHVPGEGNLPLRGYDQSKWVAEELVRRARSKGLVGIIYRLGDVMPHSVLGVPNQRSASHLLLQACVLLGIYPVTEVLFDYTPVDTVTKVILAEIERPQLRGGTFHLFHPEGATLTEIMESFASLKEPVRPVPVSEFYRHLRSRARAKGSPLGDAVTLLSVLLAHVERTEDQNMSVEKALTDMFASPSARFSQVRSERCAKPVWPPIGETLLKPYLECLRASRAASSGPVVLR